MRVIHNQQLNGTVGVRFGDLKNGELFYTDITGEDDMGLVLCTKMEDFFGEEDDDIPCNTVPVGWSADFHLNTKDEDIVFPVNKVEVS